MTYLWLVENFTKDGKSTGLYMACQVNMTVTADVNAARKFRRQITAEFRALDMREARRGDWRAVVEAVPLPERDIFRIADGEFPDWRIDIQERFVVELARAIERAHGIAPKAAQPGAEHLEPFKRG
jgi:hypothetical protein